MYETEKGFPGGASGKDSDSEVAQSCPTLCDPMDSSQPGSSVHGIFQASILEWVAISDKLKMDTVSTKAAIFLKLL